MIKSWSRGDFQLELGLTHDDSWTCITDDLSSHYYSGGYVSRVFSTIDGAKMRIPFSSLAFDAETGVLYAGAGHGRTKDDTRDSQSGLPNGPYRDFYPTTLGNGTGNDLQYSLWRCDLALGHTVTPMTRVQKGQVRQIAVAKYALGDSTVTEILFACDDGVFVHTPGGVDPEPVWPNATESGFEFALDSNDAWGVGAGANGTGYALTSRVGSSLSPGIWKTDLKVRPRNAPHWDKVEGDTDLYWAGSLAYSWTNFLRSPGSDLSELTVVPGPPDQIYVGEGRNGPQYGNAGYFRFGPYLLENTKRTGWAHIHRTSYVAQDDTIFVADWQGENIHETPLLPEDEGWLGYYRTLTALAPFAVHPADSTLMVGIDYGIPLITDDGGESWNNLYCTGDPANGWQSRGLNLMCSRSSTFLSDGRLLMGAWDFGVFAAVDSTNSAFQTLHDPEHATPPSWPKCEDVEAVRYNGGDEIYMVDISDAGANNSSDLIDKIWCWKDAPGVTTSWLNVSSGLAQYLAGQGQTTTKMDITDIAFLDETTMFVAAAYVDSVSRRFYICEGKRTGSPSNWSWEWNHKFEVDPSCTVSRAVNRICIIPNTTKLLFGAKYKNDPCFSLGGLYCLDYATGAIARWPLGGSTNERARLSRNVTAIEVDRLGKYVYVGTSGHDSHNSAARGGVARLTLVGGDIDTTQTVILAGRTNTPDPFGLGGTNNFYGTSAADWEYCAHIYDIAIDPGNPLIAYAALGNGSYFDEQFGVWRFSGNQMAHFSGNEEAGSGAATIAIGTDSPTKMYVGTYAQEFFETPITLAAHPSIADTTVYPVLAGSSVVLAVRIASADSVKIATADLTGLGLADSVVTLRDDGLGDDIKRRDGIFTASGIAASLVFGETCSVRVFAQAYDGGYDQQEVVVPVVESKARFVDVTGDTGALAQVLAEQPYSAAYFKSQPGVASSEDIMVVTFDTNASVGPDGRPRILHMTQNAVNGAPVFANATPAWIGGEGLPAGSRGVSCADYDNDGDNDFFLCNPSSGGRLYENRLRHHATYADVTDSVFGADVSLISGALAAAWGDYNRDGFIDLAVTKTGYMDPMKDMTLAELSANPSSYGMYLFRNTGKGEDGGLAKTLFSYESNSGANLLLSACWVDLDKDGGPELAVSNFVGSYVTVYRNLGYYAVLGDNVLTPSGWSVPASDFVGANSVSVIDYDHDPYPDLLVTEACGDFRSRVLRNNYDELGQDRTFTVVELGSGTEWSGAVAADYDLNGQEDILFFPKSAHVAPRLLMATAYSETPEYSDRGFTLGLRDGATGGAVAADFDGDGKCDLFMGRDFQGQPDGKQSLYQNDRQLAMPNHWIGVRLRSVGNSNGALIGTKVTVIAGLQQWTKIIDGGSGRGGQSANQLVFGLGSVASGVSISVEYPSGDSETRSANLVLDGYNDFEELNGVQFATGGAPNPACDYELGPGVADFIFKWRTAPNKGDVRLDEVTVKNVNGYRSVQPCYIGVSRAVDRVIRWGDADADFRVYWDGTSWQHEVRWRALPCAPYCSHSYKVKSGVGTTVVETPNWVQMTPTLFCVEDPGYDPNQP